MREKERRIKVAREAAKLLYYNLARDYKQAKNKARKELCERVLPTNFDVAIELDRLADEVEGKARSKLIIRLRRKGLQIMKHLKDFNPKLIGSVWRGTAKKGSDIDITVYSDNSESVLGIIQKKYRVSKAEYSHKTTRGKTEKYFHIFILLDSNDEAEVVVRDLTNIKERRRCEIFSDNITGLTIEQLKEVLKRDPTKRFIPKREI